MFNTPASDTKHEVVQLTTGSAGGSERDWDTMYEGNEQEKTSHGPGMCCVTPVTFVHILTLCALFFDTFEPFPRRYFSTATWEEHLEMCFLWDLFLVSWNALCANLNVHICISVYVCVHVLCYLLMDAVPSFNEAASMAQRMLAQRQQQSATDAIYIRLCAHRHVCVKRLNKSKEVWKRGSWCLSIIVCSPFLT